MTDFDKAKEAAWLKTPQESGANDPEAAALIRRAFDAGFAAGAEYQLSSLNAQISEKLAEINGSR